MNILRSVEWRVTWPQGLPMQLLVASVKLAMSSSFLYSPERQRRIVRLFMASLDQVPKDKGPLSPVKQRVLIRKIAEVAQVNLVVIPGSIHSVCSLGSTRILKAPCPRAIWPLSWLLEKKKRKMEKRRRRVALRRPKPPRSRLLWPRPPRGRKKKTFKAYPSQSGYRERE